MTTSPNLAWHRAAPGSAIYETKHFKLLTANDLIILLVLKRFLIKEKWYSRRKAKMVQLTNVERH